MHIVNTEEGIVPSAMVMDQQSTIQLSEPHSVYNSSFTLEKKIIYIFNPLWSPFVVLVLYYSPLVCL